MFNYTQPGYQSNYPQSYGSYQGYGPPGGGYMNSGPPPPPMGGAFAQNAYSAHGGGYTAYNAYNPGGGYMSAMMNTAAQSMNSMYSQYSMGSHAPPQPPQPPQSYSFVPSANQGMYDMQMQQQMYKSMGVFTPAAPVTNEDGKKVMPTTQEEQEDDSSSKKKINSDMKEQMKRIFVDELMRRYTLSGTFDVSNGTVTPMLFYPEDDPATPYALEEKGESAYDPEKPPEWMAEADCKHLRDAMKGLGTDESIITRIVSTRSNEQRQKLKKMFKTMYGRDLIEDIKSELSGDYKDAILACFVSPAHFDARCIKKAIYGAGTDELALIEILMTRTNAQIQAIRDVYGRVARPNKMTTDTLIEDDIAGDTSGDFKRLLVSAAQGNRYEVSRDEVEKAVEEILNASGEGTGMFQVNYSKLSNMRKAQADAKKLVAAGVDKWGTDEETFTRIFATRHFFQLRATYKEYVKITQADIRHDIDDETSGNYRRGLKAVADVIHNRPKFFAKKLMKAMKGLGTDETTLIRIIASRSEIDMVQIKHEFLSMTGKTLYRWIAEDTSFNFKKILQALVKEEVEQ